MMIVMPNCGVIVSNESELQRYWTTEYRWLQADRVFGRVRRAGRLRRLGRLLGLRPTAGSVRIAADNGVTGVGSAGRLMVSIDSVVGVVDLLSGTVGPVPVLNRGWRTMWRRFWMEEDMDSLPALPVIRGAGGWYIVNDPVPVMILEMLRAKGVVEVRTTQALSARGTPPSTNQGGKTEKAGAETEYHLVECDRDYECTGHEDSRAV